MKASKIMKKKSEQYQRFIATARELDVSETDADQDKACGKIGLKKPASKTTKKK
jgi:hypothetical protein